MMKKTPTDTLCRSQMVDFLPLGMKEAAAVSLKLLQDIRMMKKKKRNKRRIPRRMKRYTNSSPGVRWWLVSARLSNWQTSNRGSLKASLRSSSSSIKQMMRMKSSSLRSSLLISLGRNNWEGSSVGTADWSKRISSYLQKMQAQTLAPQGTAQRSILGMLWRRLMTISMRRNLKGTRRKKTSTITSTPSTNQTVRRTLKVGWTITSWTTSSKRRRRCLMRRKSGLGMPIYYKNFTIRYRERKKKKRKTKVMNEIDWSQLVIIKLTTYLKNMHAKVLFDYLIKR